LTLPCATPRENWTTRNAVRKALQAAKFDSVRGAFKFNTNQFPIQDYYLRVITKRHHRAASPTARWARCSSSMPMPTWVHGGYWRALSSKDFSGVALGLHPLGITTVVINYALCPFVTIDEITRQTRAATAWVLRHIDQYGGDPTRVAIGGHSAGGHLTAMCLQTEWARDYGLPQDPLAGAVAFSGLYDLEPLRYSYLQPLIQLDDGIIRRNSPAYMVRPCKTPLWITWGGDESGEFARQSQTYHDAWQAAGNQSNLQVQPGANHFTVIHSLEDAHSPVCQWIRQTLTPA
jgi:arylformamidase